MSNCQIPNIGTNGVEAIQYVINKKYIKENIIPKYNRKGFFLSKIFRYYLVINQKLQIWMCWLTTGKYIEITFLREIPRYM